MATFHQRYLAGEHEAVWSELTALGPTVREQPVYADALAVARETMRRVRHNVETLAGRLEEIGYVFGVSEAGCHFDNVPLMSPSEGARSEMDRLESLVGTLPMSLRAWVDNVGVVNFQGHHPEWRWDTDNRYGDPLVMAVVPAEVRSAHSDWLENVAEFGSEEEGPFLLEVSPDFWHKSNMSGGPAYSFALPDSSADARLLEEPNGLNFIPYLRLCCRWGGFPGHGAGREPSGMPAEHLSYLTSGLLPF